MVVELDRLIVTFELTVGIGVEFGLVCDPCGGADRLQKRSTA